MYVDTRRYLLQSNKYWYLHWGTFGNLFDFTWLKTTTH